MWIIAEHDGKSSCSDVGYDYEDSSIGKLQSANADVAAFNQAEWKNFSNESLVYLVAEQVWYICLLVRAISGHRHPLYI
jgi:hypothetical protein